MSNGGGFAMARCVYCREEVQVLDRYAHGDHIKCGKCGTKHKVVRGERLRLVVADVGPLRETLAQNESLVARLESELRQARYSFGLGANGILIGVVYAAYQVFANRAPIETSLLFEAAALAAVSALLLEAANWGFLGKRSRITRLTHELEDARVEGARIRALLRDAAKV
jgi:hypothetical protein